MKLMYRSRSWYLQAYCSKNQVNRLYKVNRMADLLVTEENFLLERQEQAFFQSEKEESKDLVRLQLLFSKELAYRVFDEFDANEIKLVDHGGLLVTTTVPEDQWIYAFLLSFGTGVQIIAPLYIKETLVNQIQKMLQHYQ